MELFLAKAIGWLLAHLPLSLGERFCRALGTMIYLGWRAKRQLVLSNLHHAFPEMERDELSAMGKIAFQRMIEMGYLSAMSPFLSDEKIRARYRLDDSFHALADRYHASPFPILVLTMHFSQLESSSFLPVLRDDIPPTGVIFRPMNQKKVEAWMRETRSRGTFYLMPRKEGFLRAKEILRKREAVALFFDQNAGSAGSLSLFMGRISSNSELPDILHKIPDTACYILYTERTAFCQGRISMHSVTVESPEASVQHAAHQWLENQLLTDKNARQDWLWLHKRWKTQTEPRKRFRIEQRRNDLPAQDLPKKFRLWVYLSNTSEDIDEQIAVCRRLASCRPDVALTLCVLDSRKSEFTEKVDFACEMKELSATSNERQQQWKEFYWEFPDVVIAFENRADVHREIALCAAPQRFGWRYPDQKKKPLTHAYVQKKKGSSRRETLEEMVKYFGLS